MRLYCIATNNWLTATPHAVPQTEETGDTIANKEQDDNVVSETPIRREHGGPQGPEPTRYGDWERNGRCFDF